MWTTSPQLVASSAAAQKECLKVEEQVDKNNKTDGETSKGHCTATGAGRPGVRLHVVPVTVCYIDEAHKVQTYALLDNGSDVQYLYEIVVSLNDSELQVFQQHSP